MGCASSKEKDPRKKEATASAAGAAGGEGSKPVKAATDSAKQDPAVTKTTESTEKMEGEGVNGLNVLHADKMDLKDLVEKESFHDCYILGEVLGRGNYSVVRKATKKGTDEVYAVKCIKEASLTPEDREALKIETAILKGIDSPHIIKLFGFYEEKKEKTFYIVTEFVGGGELFDRIIAKEFYSEEDAQKLVSTIAKAIQYIHARGVVHRDLKPENILLTSKDDDDSIKIADFGFAKQYDTSSDDALSTSCGTPGYVAPEILNGKKYGKEVDMWSFGVIIYILLCGYPPFHHDNQKELFRQIRSAKYEFDEEYWGQVSDAAKDLIRKLLVVNGAERLTIDQLLEHEWLKAKVTNSLSGVKPGIQNIMNKRRLKAGINAVIAQNRIKKLVQGAQDAAQQLEAEQADSEPSSEQPKATEPEKTETETKPAATTPAPAPASPPAPAATSQDPANPSTSIVSE